MLTPFQISDRVAALRLSRRALRRHDQLGQRRIVRETIALYREVLHEIAKGTIDARSLASAVLQAEENLE